MNHSTSIAYNFFMLRRKKIWLISSERSFKTLSESHGFQLISFKNGSTVISQSTVNIDFLGDRTIQLWLLMILNTLKHTNLVGLIWKSFQNSFRISWISTHLGQKWRYSDLTKYSKYWFLGWWNHPTLTDYRFWIL